MSWKLTKQVRELRLAGQLPGINFAEFAVLLLMADTCRGESRVASISTTELVRLSGQSRSAMWRKIEKLIALGYVRQCATGNQHQTSRYEVLPDARCTDATSTQADARCTDATSTGAEHVAFSTEHVAFSAEHVAFSTGAGCASATLPSLSRVFPEEYPKGGAGAREAALPAVPAPHPPPMSLFVNRATEQLAAVHASDEMPSPYCARHPNGTDKQCRLCGLAAEVLTDWYRFHKPSGTDSKIAKWQSLRRASDEEPQSNRDLFSYRRESSGEWSEA